MKSGLNADSLTIANLHAWTLCHSVHHQVFVFQDVFAKKALFSMQKDFVSYHTHVIVLNIWNLTNVEVLANQPVMIWLPYVQTSAFRNVLAGRNISSTVKVFVSTIHNAIQQHCHTGARQQMSLPLGIVRQLRQQVPQQQAELYQTVVTMLNSVIVLRTKHVRHHAITLFPIVPILVANKSALATMAFS